MRVGVPENGTLRLWSATESDQLDAIQRQRERRMPDVIAAAERAATLVASAEITKHRGIPELRKHERFSCAGGSRRWRLR